jgi:aldose 1-epimerase
MSLENGLTTKAGDWQGEPAYILRDEETGSEAMVIPGMGANCVAWSITDDGQRLELMETPPTPESLRTRKFRSGMPVLWPFPGRVRDARYKFQGKEYHLPRTDKGGVHHIHGIVIESPWRVAETGAGEEGAKLALTIGPQDLDEEMRAGYPFDFSLTLTFTLKEWRLTIDLLVENKETEQSLPFGYGLHPYFRSPILPSKVTPDRSVCPVHIPADQSWPTKDGIPTGPAQELPAELDFREWRPLGTRLYDNMYGGAQFSGDWSVAGYREPGAELEIQVQADHNFHDWVLFTHPTHPSVCIEPYTCPPNAINFEEEGIPGSNLVVLEPGKSWQAHVILQAQKYKA